MDEKYILVTDRDGLNTLISTLATTESVETLVDKNGEISFNIPYESPFQVKTVDYGGRITKKIETLEESLNKYKEGGRKYKEILAAIKEHQSALLVLLEVTTDIIMEDE